MTTPADDTAVEDAFEAFLAGRPVPEEAAGLAVFAEAVRATATQPGRPNAALAELLATGLLADQSSPSTRTAPSAGAPPSRRVSRARNRRRFAMIFPALLAKILSAGAVAQAATGAGVVIVVAAGAGATGVLGEGVQDSIAGVVGAADEETPEDGGVLPEQPVLAEKDPTVADPGDVALLEEGTSVEVSLDEVQAAIDEWIAGPTDEHKNFGTWVSSMAGDHDAKKLLLARTGYTFSELVRMRGEVEGLTDEELQSELANVNVELEEPTDGTTDASPDAGTEAQDAGPEVAETEDGDRGGRGNGNGNGNSNGKAKGSDRN